MTAATLEEIAHALDGRKTAAGYECKCPAHEDRKASLSLSNGDKGVVFFCHAGCPQADVIEALKSRGLWNGTRKQEQRIVATYDYVDQHGKLVSQAVRYLPKDFKQRRSDGAGGWVWKMEGVERVPYRLPEVLAAIAAGEPVYIVEGEKDADNLRKLGLVATCNAAGAGKWQASHAQWLKGAKVVILPDNDDPGRDHAQKVAKSLAGIACLGRLVELPGLLPKQDVSDWLAAGGSKWELDELVAAAAPLDFPPLDIGPVTMQTWQLPKLLPTSAENQGHVHDVDVADLLTRTNNFLRRFVAYPSPHAAIAHTLWIAHAHGMEHWESTPRIAFLSPEPGSGKTRAIEITETLVPRPVESVNATAAYLFRKVSDPEGAPTLLYDEIDTLFGPKAKDNEEIRGMLNAGHRRGAVAGRCVVRGKLIETEELPAFCAVAMAGLGNLPDTILSRSVIVGMRRRGPDEVVEPYRRRIHAPEGNALRDELAAWMASAASKFSEPPAMPAGIEDRDADVWEALLAVADAAGGHWPESARVSAVTLVTLAKAATPSLGVRLLADLKQVFGDREAMPTQEILNALVALEEAPWSDIKGKPLDGRRLGNYLRRYDVTSKTVRAHGGIHRGYTRADLHDPWTRYLPKAENVTLCALTPVHSSRGLEGKSLDVEGKSLDVGESHIASVTTVTSLTTDCVRCDGEGCGWCK